MAEVLVIAEKNDKKRVRCDSEEDSDSDSLDAAKRIRYDLLEILDDSEVVADRSAAAQDLDSVMKSFEEEITMLPSSSSSPSSSPVLDRAPPAVDLTSDSGDSQPDLGYLLEASDDELGLPPAFSEEEKNDESDVLSFPTGADGFDQIWRFEDEIPSYEFGIDDVRDGSSGSDFVALESLFDYSDVMYGQPDLSWQSESLPAL